MSNLSTFGNSRRVIVPLRIDNLATIWHTAVNTPARLVISPVLFPGGGKSAQVSSVSKPPASRSADLAEFSKMFTGKSTHVPLRIKLGIFCYYCIFLKRIAFILIPVKLAKLDTMQFNPQASINRLMEQSF